MYICIFLYLMILVIGSGLDNLFLFCKLLFEENSIVEDSIVEELIIL